MELRDLGGALWRQRLLALLVLLVVAAGCAVGWALGPKTYVATATLAAVDDPAVDPGDDTPTDLRRTLAALAGTRSVVARAERVADTGIPVDDLVDHVSGRWVPGTVLVEVDVEDGDPRTAADLANAVVEVLPSEDPGEAFLLSVRDRAEPPRDPSGPHLLLVLLLAAGAGLALAVVAAVARDARSHTVASGAGVESATSAPLLAHLRAPRDPGALPALEPGTAGAAAFTGLVAALGAETSRRPVDRVVVAGVGLGDAPAWIAANLAVALAADRTTLLVDARLGSRFGRRGPGEPDTAGLHEVLLDGDLDGAVSPGPVAGLSVLPSGGWGLEPPPGLVAERFEAVAEQARSRFGAVVVIAPPLDASDDGRVMAAGAGLLLVVPEQRLVPGELRAHADRVRVAGARLVGVVLVGPHDDREARG